MKTIVLTICLFFSVITMNAQEVLSGVYDMGKANTKVEIKGSEGKVISSDRLEVGTLMLKDIKSDNDGEWKCKLYSVKKNKWYNARLEEQSQKLLVKVKAGMMEKTLEWEKE